MYISGSAVLAQAAVPEARQWFSYVLCCTYVLYSTIRFCGKQQCLRRASGIVRDI